ncbi:MAG: GLPGLI family protein [Bacteroides sp.]|nr:GLPGLI family protein [Bacteroides sp.]MCM1448574.1 GLPGLI family protein [Bacteroides sp.]
MEAIRSVFVIIIMWLSVGCVYAQQKQGCVMRPSSKGTGNVIDIGMAQLKVMYALNALDVKDENTYIDLHVLLAGQNMSKHYSRFLELNDSLYDVFNITYPNAGGRPRIMYSGGRNSNYWSEYQFTDIYMENGKYTCYARMPWAMERYNAYYTEPTKQQLWLLHGECQNILGYRCQRATCNWRGRTFEAWFAIDIPVRLGPWIFGGLPGLILKLNDTNNIYTWEAVSLCSGSFHITKPDYKGFVEDTREHVHRLQVAANRNFLQIAGARDRQTGQLKSQPHPYEPLEIE